MGLLRRWDINRDDELVGAILELRFTADDTRGVDLTVRVVAHTEEAGYTTTTPQLEQYDTNGQPLHTRGYYAQGTIHIQHNPFDATAAGLWKVGVYDKWAPTPLADQLWNSPAAMPEGRLNKGNWGAVYVFHARAENPSDEDRRMRVMFMARHTNLPGKPATPYAAAVKSGGFPPQSNQPRVEELLPIQNPTPQAGEFDTAYVPFPQEWGNTWNNDWTVPSGGSVASQFTFMHAGASTLPVCIVYERR
jgi:hypothetical protein